MRLLEVKTKILEGGNFKMKKMGMWLLVVAVVVCGISFVHPAIVKAEDAAKPADSAKPAATGADTAAPAPADAAKAEPAATEDEGSDDVAVLKEAAKELRAAGKTALADKVQAIADGMDW